MKFHSLLFVGVLGGSMAWAQQAVPVPVQTPMPSNVQAQQAVVGNARVPVQNTQGLQVVTPNTQIMPPNAARSRSRIPVKTIALTPQGTARLTGSVRGLGMDVYQFSANAGDSIRIVSAKATAMEFAIFRPDMGMRFGNYQVLPQSGTYELRIVNNRADSARNKTPRHYDVTFTLTRGQY